MKRSLVWPALFLAASLSAQVAHNALLWRIGGNALSAPAFLYGTVHSRAELAYTFSNAVERCMDSVSTVAGELDLEEGRRQAMVVMYAMIMPDGMVLRDLYKKKDWAVVEAGLNAKLGPMAPLVTRMKPFMVLATISGAGTPDERELMLDDHLLRRAKALGVRVIGLESMEEQLRAMDALPLKEQAALLLDQLRNDAVEQDMAAMLEAYARQDIDALMAIGYGGSAMPELLQKSLVTNRNRVMAHRMDSVLRADGSALFLIGAAHLPGQSGVLELMRTRGYSVEPVAIAPTPEEPPFVPAMLLHGGIRYTNDTLGFRVDMPVMPQPSAVEGNSSHWRMNVHDAVTGGIVIISSDQLGPGQRFSGLDELVAKEFSLDAALEVRVSDQQGLDARRVTFEADDRRTGTLVMVRGDRVIMVIAISSMEAAVDAVLDSFRFIDLPE